MRLEDLPLGDNTRLVQWVDYNVGCAEACRGVRCQGYCFALLASTTQLMPKAGLITG